MCNNGHTCVTPGLYAMVGAAAALGGVTRMTGMYSTPTSFIIQYDIVNNLHVLQYRPLLYVIHIFNLVICLC